MKKRTNATQLPSPEAVKEIFSVEAEREVPHRNADLHFVSLAVLDKLSAFDVDLDFMKGAGFEEIIELGHNFIKSFLRAYNSGKIPEEVCMELYDYLTEQDPVSESDGIFVFGRDGDMSRAVKGVELFNQGLAPKLILSGGCPIYKQSERSEAEIMTEYALERGVPADSIIIEDESRTIAGNVKGSLNKFDEIGYDWNRLILVMSPFAMRRALGFFQKYTVGKEFVRIGVDWTEDKATRQEWLQKEESIRLVMNEFVKHRIALFTNTC